ncbi:MAG: hypothetical protein VW080_08580, partial [Flavobacteriaceae bacterium]
EKLSQFLESLPGIKKVVKTHSFYKVTLNAPLSEEKLAHLLAKEKIYATHFVKKIPSLEQQFLHLTKSQYDAATSN